MEKYDQRKVGKEYIPNCNVLGDNLLDDIIPTHKRMKSFLQKSESKKHKKKIIELQKRFSELVD